MCIVSRLSSQSFWVGGSHHFLTKSRMLEVGLVSTGPQGGINLQKKYPSIADALGSVLTSSLRRWCCSPVNFLYGSNLRENRNKPKSEYFTGWLFLKSVLEKWLKSRSNLTRTGRRDSWNRVYMACFFHAATSHHYCRYWRFLQP